MDNKYDSQINQVTKTLEKAAEMKWITINPHFRLEALSHSIVGDLRELDRKRQQNEEISNAFEALRKYMPEFYAKLMKEISK